MKLLTKILIGLSLGWALSSHANDAAAHIGTAGLVNIATYGFYAKGFGMSRTEALLFSAVTTTMLGLAKEISDGQLDVRDLGHNTLGIGLSALIVYGWEF